MAAPARYRDHVERIADAIARGDMPTGTRLPPQRDYADTHGLAVSTVTRVYAELIRRGLAVGEVGRGTFVRSPAVGAAAAFAQWSPPPGPLDAIDLAFNYPVLPEQGDAMRQALRDLARMGDLSHLLAHTPHAGHATDRSAAARWLSRRDGAAVDPGDIVVCAGGQHALDVVQLALCRAGDAVAVEPLTYPGWKALAGMRDVALVAVGMQQGAMDPASLDAACRTHAGRLRGAYLMPTLHNPLGGVMSLAQRKALVDVARRHDLWLIDDSAYGFLVSDAPTPLRLLAPERTVEIVSLSKPAAPGLRVAYAVAPAALQSRLHAALRASAWSAAPMMVHVASRWLDDGLVDDWIARKRALAAHRQALARTHLAGLPLEGHPQALHLLADVAPGQRPDDIVAALQARGVAVTPVDAFAAPGQIAPPAIRVALGCPASDDILCRGLAHVADVMRRMDGSGTGAGAASKASPAG